MSAMAQGGDRRARLYGSLAMRNRVIGILRIGVPGIGLVVFLGLMAQIILPALMGGYGVGSISLDRSKVTVETPQYAGVMSDGTVYKVTAGGAVAQIERLDVITMSDAKLVMDNPDGSQTTATAQLAELQTTDEQVTVKGEMELSMSTGTIGTLVGSFIDMPTHRLTASGPVHFEFADGSRLDAGSMDYSETDKVYVFTGVSIDQPYTPSAWD